MRRFHKPHVGGRITPVPVELDGFRFHSKAEAERYGQLKILAGVGEIRDLRVHPRLSLVVNGTKIGRGWMQLDFSYEEYLDLAWRRIYEDVKGAVDTRVGQLRRQLAAACNGATIRVVSIR